MSDVERLRETSALMRARAEAATPGPWETLTTIHGAETFVVESGRGLFGTVSEPARGNEDYGKANAAHIASWHPTVALAVAEQIDAFLAMHHPRQVSNWTTYHHNRHYYNGPSCTQECVEDVTFCNGCGTSECKEIRYWLPIAEAYLGVRS